MSTDTASTATSKPAIEFKSSTFAVPALLLHSDDLTDIADKLQQKIQQAPEFFKNSPVVIDVHLLVERNQKIDVSALIKLLRGKKLIPIALRGGTSEQNKTALHSGIPVQPYQHAHDNEKILQAAYEKATTPAQQPELSEEAAVSQAPTATANPEALPATLIHTPIRSGQRIYAPGDLIVLAQVSAGAEIMAEGNIHVYNSLRGRALAGVLGNVESRIFCFDLQAELISIAGNYKVNDDLDKSIQHKPVQIYLQNHALIIKEL